jgi:methylglutaconyl-CoA hydratase
MDTLTSHIDNRGILTLFMNRPGVYNAFDAVMIGEMTAALKDADANNDVRAVIITGEGACFSAGADMNWMRSLVGASLEDNLRDAEHLAELMRSLNYLSKPTIARINGAAFGGGLGLIAACDITIAVEDARFGLTEVRLGLVPAVISPYVFRRIGEGNARRYFISGERFGCQQAVNIGLVQQCVEPAQLDEAVEKTVSNLLKGGPSAVANAKQLLFEIAGHNCSSQQQIDEFTTGLIARLRVSDEGQEGLAAFLEKRKPGWTTD